MKKFLLLTVLFLAAATQAIKAQDAVDKAALQNLLQSYYTIKDALVSGNANAASAGATAYIKTLNGISYKIISEGNVNTLLKDAGAIADAKDVKAQRQSFANFSTNMAALAKGLHLTDQPVYIQYCPMKKATWLSSDKAVKNPYFGSAMMSCGKVTETLQ